jgi:hypothetical protein
MPSVSVTTSVRHVPAHDLSVLQEYVYVSVSGSYVRLLVPPFAADAVTVDTDADVDVGHAFGFEEGDPAAKIESPWSPPRLNFTGTVLPAFVTFSVPAAIGALNPPKTTAVEGLSGMDCAQKRQRHGVQRYVPRRRWPVVLDGVADPVVSRRSYVA